MAVAVLGAGSLGSLWAARLAAGGIDTRIFARSASAVRAGRLRIHVSGPAAPPLSSEVCAHATSAAGPADVDVLLVATKAYDAPGALSSVSKRLAPGAAIVILCNGALALAERLQTPPRSSLLVATTTHGAWRRGSLSQRGAAVEVVHAGFGDTWLGPLSGDTCDEEAISKAEAAFRAAGLGATLEDGLETEERLWLKLAANAVLNPLTALWNLRNGEVLSRADGRSKASGICRELAALAIERARGSAQPRATPDAATLEEFVHACAKANALNWSSMHQDLAAGRQTEVDFLNGWVARELESHGLSGAINARLAESVKEAERLAPR